MGINSSNTLLSFVFAAQITNFELGARINFVFKCHLRSDWFRKWDFSYYYMFRVPSGNYIELSNQISVEHLLTKTGFVFLGTIDIKS